MGRAPAVTGALRRGLSVVACLAAAGSLMACGTDERSDSSTSRVAWTLVLDYEPNAVHAGLLRAERAGYFREAGIDLKIVAPSSTADALTQVSRGRAELGLGDLVDVARRNERARDDEPARGPASGDVPLAVTAAIVQQPLSGILVDADGPVRTPAGLKGRRVAVTGVPSDDAVIAAIARDRGGPVKTEPVTMMFNGLKALSTGQVAAATAYWPADEVTLRALGTRPRRFTLQDAAGISYPGLVAFTTRKLAGQEPVRVQAFADALRRGTLEVVGDRSGQTGLDAVQDSYPELDAGTTRAQLRNYRPLFGDRVTAGRVDRTALEHFSVFARRYGLTERRVDPDELVVDANQ